MVYSLTPVFVFVRVASFPDDLNGEECDVSASESAAPLAPEFCGAIHDVECSTALVRVFESVHLRVQSLMVKVGVCVERLEARLADALVVVQMEPEA